MAKAVKSLTTKVAIILLLCIVTLLACEKEVKINIANSPPQLVVEGAIEKDFPPYIILTKSVGYFARIDLATLTNNFVHDAKVTIIDGIDTIKLREYQFDTLNNTRFYFYTLDTTGGLGTNFFIGRTNHTYKLRIESEGKVYESTTRIPDGKAVDSLISEVAASPPKDLPNAVTLTVFYSDPDTFGNCVRYFTKRNSEPYYPGFNSVYDDQIVNGVKGARIPIAAGFRRTGQFTDSSGYVFRGDTITLKWSAIDRGVFNFYNTYEYALGTIGNPFSTPINVKSNISNGALGVWAGYGSTTTSIIIPK